MESQIVNVNTGDNSLTRLLKNVNQVKTNSLCWTRNGTIESRNAAMSHFGIGKQNSGGPWECNSFWRNRSWGRSSMKLNLKIHWRPFPRTLANQWCLFIYAWECSARSRPRDQPVQRHSCWRLAQVHFDRSRGKHVKERAERRRVASYQFAPPVQLLCNCWRGNVI